MVKGISKEYDSDYHTVDLLERMEKGQTNVEIWADWDISEKTFYRWLEKHDELKHAYEKGKAKWEKAWIQKGIQYMEDGNREAFKYWNRILTVKGSKEWKEQNKSTNVNIGQITQVNNYEGKTEKELAQILQDKLEKLRLPAAHIIPADYQVIELEPIKEDLENDESKSE